MPDRIRLDGRVAVVTGAAGVIGSAAMRLLAERGAQIVAVDRRQADLQAAIMDLPASAQALAVTADVTREGEVAGYVRAAVDSFGAIDVFFNNAGVEGEIAPITRYSLETFRKVIDVNVIGVFLGLKHVLPVMLNQNKGSIINTASIAGLIGATEIAAYTATKQERCAGMQRHRRTRQLRLPRIDRQPHAERDHRRPQSRQGACSRREDRGAHSGPPARKGV
jgi:NADP-dependent 3-hydroxy acid dehydrogenase YdfG